MLTLAVPSDDTLCEIRRHRRTKKMLVSVMLVSFALVLNACISFGMLTLISGALGMLNSMGVFGDGKMSEIIGMVSMVGTMVGMVGGMMYGFDTGVNTLWGGAGGGAGATVPATTKPPVKSSPPVKSNGGGTPQLYYC